MSHHHHHQCQDGQCSIHGEKHDLCAQEICSCCCGHEHECQSTDFPDQLFKLADDAWMELLKEKIKDQIEKLSGKRLDELAKLVNDANHSRWHNIFADKTLQEGYREKLRQFFHQPDDKKSKKG